VDRYKEKNSEKIGPAIITVQNQQELF